MEIPLEQRKQHAVRLLKRKTHQLQHRLQKAQEEYQINQNWPQIYQEAILIQSNLYQIRPKMDRLQVLDWTQDQLITIALDPQKKPQEEIAFRLKLSKKKKASLPYLKQYLDKIALELNQIFLAQEQLLQIKEEKEWQNFQEQNKVFFKSTSISKLVSQQKNSSPHKYRLYHSVLGDEIYVGKSAKNNDWLTFTFAKGNDWWMHVSDYPGSHVVLKCKNKGEFPPRESLEDAKQIALHYSKAKTHREGEICITQCKYVRRLGRKAGQVTLAQHHQELVKEDTNRLNRLLAKLIP